MTVYHDSYIGLMVSVQQYRSWTLGRIIVLLLGKTLLFTLTVPLW